jgi:transposase
LSHAEKDALALMLQGQITALHEAVKQLESRLVRNSKNSSKPPSSDGLNKPTPKSLRVTGQKQTGRQKGQPGSTLCQATQPDKIVIYGVPVQCQTCRCSLMFAYVGEHARSLICPR